MARHVTLEITITVTLEVDEQRPTRVEILGWQFDVAPPQVFRALAWQNRMALWATLRDEIEEFWLSTALESSPDATWNHLLEDVPID
jgi:hypothetical protein